MIEKILKKESMIKLNGNIYLKSCEVEKIVNEQAKRFRTSHRAILPQQVTYLDREFVIIIQEEEKNICLSSSFLYGYKEDHAPIKKIIQSIHDRFRKEEDCSNKLYFMQYDITDKQKKQYRKNYENFLINVFLDECIKKMENLS
tara:strand:+ start:1891 stop:2322 length:432 start_codon:yes stop_codon:yes gene_type:complete